MIKIKTTFSKKYTTIIILLCTTSLFILSCSLYFLKIFILSFIFYPVLILIFLFSILFRVEKYEWVKPKTTKEDIKYFSYIEGLQKKIKNVFNFTSKEVK